MRKKPRVNLENQIFSETGKTVIFAHRVCWYTKEGKETAKIVFFFLLD